MDWKGMNWNGMELRPSQQLFRYVGMGLSWVEPVLRTGLDWTGLDRIELETELN